MDGRFPRGVSGNPAGRPHLTRQAEYLAARARFRAVMLLEWVRRNVVHCSGASVMASGAQLLLAAEALEQTAATLRGLSHCRVAVDSHGTTDQGTLPAGGRG